MDLRWFELRRCTQMLNRGSAIGEHSTSRVMVGIRLYWERFDLAWP